MLKFLKDAVWYLCTDVNRFGVISSFLERDDMLQIPIFGAAGEWEVASWLAGWLDDSLLSHAFRIFSFAVDAGLNVPSFKVKAKCTQKENPCT
jgi:hypothetical protein